MGASEGPGLILGPVQSMGLRGGGKMKHTSENVSSPSGGPLSNWGCCRPNSQMNKLRLRKTKRPSRVPS